MSTGSALTRTSQTTRQSKKSGKSVSSKSTRKQDVCDLHKWGKLDLFCVYHQCLICAFCKEDQHESCSNVLPVGEASVNFSQTDSAYEWGKILRILLSQCTSVVKERRYDERELKTSKSNIELYVKNYRKSIVDKIDRLVDQIMKEVNSVYQKEQEKIQTNILELSKIVQTLEDKLTDIEMAKNVSADLPLFMAVQTAIDKHTNMKSTLNQIHDKAQKVTLKLENATQIANLTIGELKLKCKPYDILPRPKSHPKLESKGNKGEVNKDSKIKLLGEHNVRGVDDAKCCITGIRIFPDNFSILADNNNNCVKFMSPDYKLIHDLRLEHPPFDLALLSDTEVAVTSPEISSIILLHVNERKSVEHQKSIKLSQKDCYGITTYDSHFIVTSLAEKCVKMIDMKGEEKWTLAADNQSQPLFSWPWYVAVHEQNHEIYISDRNMNMIIRAQSNGEYRKCFNAKDSGPRGMAFDGRGNLLVCHFMTDELEMQSLGVFDEASTLGTKADGIKHPQCLAMVNGDSHFVLSSYNSNSIKVFQIN